ncbi:ParA family protein [Algoriphagus boritolerans]
MKTISIMNHKGGTGKTTSSINIGAGLAKKRFQSFVVGYRFPSKPD